MQVLKPIEVKAAIEARIGPINWFQMEEMNWGQTLGVAVEFKNGKKHGIKFPRNATIAEIAEEFGKVKIEP